MGKRTRSTTPASEQDAATHDSLDCLLLWLVAVDGDRAVNALRPLGVERAELERLKQAHPELLERMRRLQIAGQLLLRDQLATLLRARLGEELVHHRHDAKAMALLTTAMSRMALWMFWRPPNPDLEPPSKSQLLNGEAPASAEDFPKVRMGH